MSVVAIVASGGIHTGLFTEGGVVDVVGTVVVVHVVVVCRVVRSVGRAGVSVVLLLLLRGMV